MTHPTPSAVLELLKPITWFAPMWAYGCGVVSSGVPAGDRWPLVIAGIVLAGPLICATSQAVNDWYDRDVDAINEPNRPIPSGRLPGRWGFYFHAEITAAEAAAAALRAGETGTVVVRVDVDATGYPNNATVIQRSGSRELDRAATDAVRRWRFTPAQSNGQAVPGSIEVPFDFKTQ